MMDGEIRSMVQAGRLGEALMHKCKSEMDYHYIASSAAHADINIERCCDNFGHFVLTVAPRLTLTPMHLRAITDINCWADNPMHTQHLMLNMPHRSCKTTLAALAAAWLTLKLGNSKDGGDVTVATLRGGREHARRIAAAHLSGLIELNPMKARMRTTVHYGCAALMFALHGDRLTGITRNFLVADEFPGHPIADMYRWRQSLTLGTWDGEVDKSRSPMGICTDVVDLRPDAALTWEPA